VHAGLFTLWTQVFRINEIIDAIPAIIDAISSAFDAITKIMDAIPLSERSKPYLPAPIAGIIPDNYCISPASGAKKTKKDLLGYIRSKTSLPTRKKTGRETSPYPVSYIQIELTVAVVAVVHV
jgi:hypothetical protein